MKLGKLQRGSGQHLTLVHGFTQNAHSWNSLVDELESRFSCRSLDAPGHGASTDGQRSLQQCGTDIAESMENGILVGYSMGARMALHTALQHSEKVSRLVLISGTAGIDSESERSSRRDSDNELAKRIEEIGVEQFIAEWLALPMFSGLTSEAAQVPERLRNTSKGLADSLRYAGTGTQEPLWNRLKELQMPVLLIAGERDQKFAQLAHRMHAEIEHSHLEIIRNSGHTVHLEQPAEFIRVFSRFAS